MERKLFGAALLFVALLSLFLLGACQSADQPETAEEPAETGELGDEEPLNDTYNVSGRPLVRTGSAGN